MIIAVEGPSAAGKTTWCRTQTERFISEYTPTGSEPDGTDVDEQADYWVAVNSARWAEALVLEASDGVAVCDSDPLKLHYSWCLAMIGAATWSRFEQEYERCRAAFKRRELGMADIVLVNLPVASTLRAQRESDPTRARRSFELHVRLREPLRAWYQAIDRLDPGRVFWVWPHDLRAAATVGPRPDRYDVHLLDGLVRALDSR